jgi:hypothetical protein
MQSRQDVICTVVVPIYSMFFFVYAVDLTYIVVMGGIYSF